MQDNKGDPPSDLKPPTSGSPDPKPPPAATFVEGNIAVQKLGVFAGLAITLTAVGQGFFLIHADKDISGLAVSIASLASLVGVFIYGRRSQERERAEKSKLFHDEC